MHVSRESRWQTDQRVGRVLAMSEIELLPGEWHFEEFPHEALPGRARTDALALVRDDGSWSQLVPVGASQDVAERFEVRSIHFPAGIDNSGFVGWLASALKRAIGTGAFVVCGQNSRRGGIHDYWGCPVAVGREVGAELRRLIREPESAPALGGRRFRVASRDSEGVVGPGTVLEFYQDGQLVWAEYAGGAVARGFLVGRLEGTILRFRYAQAGADERVDGGHSVAEMERLEDGRLRLREHFEWDSRAGHGTNVFEEMP